MRFVDTIPPTIDITYMPARLGCKSAVRLHRWGLEGKIPNLYDMAAFHITILYTTTVLPDISIARYPTYYRIDPSDMTFQKFGEAGNYLVIEVKCPALEQRWTKLSNQFDFEKQFETFRPHISLSANAKDVDIASLPPITFPIYLRGEEFIQFQKENPLLAEIQRWDNELNDNR